LNTIYLPPLHITAPAYEDPFTNMYYVGGTNGPIRNYNLDMGLTGYIDPFGPDTPANLHAFNVLLSSFDTGVENIKATFDMYRRNLPGHLDAEIESLARQNSIYGPSLLQQLTARIAAVHQLYGLKNSELIGSESKANKSFGADRQANLNDYIDRMAKYNRRDGGQSPYQSWHDSVFEYHKVHLLRESKGLLVNKLAGLEASFNSEQARITFEHHQQQAIAQQQQLAAQQEAQRAAEDAEARRVAEEQRVAKEAEVRRRAEEKRAAEEAEAKRVAEEAAAKRLAEEEKSAQKKEEAKPQADANQIHVSQMKVAGAFSPTFMLRTGAGLSALNAAQFGSLGARAAASLRSAIEAFVRSARDFSAEAAKQVAAVFSSLLIPTALDNGEFFASSVPASDLLSDIQFLPEVAAVEGTVDLPGWAGILENTGSSPVMVLEPSYINAAAPIEVREATYDAENNVYSVAAPHDASLILTWTPSVFPDDSSTSLPSQTPTNEPYTGITLPPIEIDAWSKPVAPPNLHGLITVFPADSGLPPIFTVYSDPYADATTTGEHSGRAYNPEKAGGPIQDLSWEDASITQEGVDLVKLHTGRLDHSAANDVMIDRLEKILAGEVALTDTDKRYYTHEIRELERYRAIGVGDGPVGEEVKEAIWNNAHTATLEDYKLQNDEPLIYTPEALSAGQQQEQDFYNKLLQEMM